MPLVHGSEVNLAERYRLAMRNLAAAVAVVTTFDPDGRQYGTTVSAFMPLSMDPPLLLVSLDSTSRLLALVVPGQSVGVNVLAADRGDLGRQFSQPSGDRWLGVPWRPEADAPALIERHAFIGITVERQILAGDHTLLVGSVTSADWEPGEPLLYWQREFGTFQRV